ncbi:MAG: glycerol-3-phosphate acyltransferase [Lachnospiraceae bacterium]|jgi:glycerol-3-phosphate acyltransferase PlsY|nr:glycerol-3-phosphate acyltransferase [Lachnospiraceae bacterium]
MWRIFSVLIGYICGCFLTAESVARHEKGVSASKLGTGNPGMANIMAECGFVPGLLVLSGDLGKTLFACLFCRFLLFPSHGAAAAAFAGLGCVLGHNFPAWNGFRGGKGVSCTCAAIVCVDPFAGFLSLIIGMLFTFLTKYLPIGAVLIPAAFLPMSWLLYGKDTGIAVLLMTLIMVRQHFPGLRGAAKGTEPTVDVPALLNKKFGRAAAAVTVAAAVLLAVLLIRVLCGPWYDSYMAAEGTATCTRARQDLCLQWDGLVQSAEKSGGSTDAAALEQMMEETARDRYGAVLSGDGAQTGDTLTDGKQTDGSQTGGTLTGVCRDGGTWTLTIDPDTKNVTIVCSHGEHGTYLWEYKRHWGEIK